LGPDGGFCLDQCDALAMQEAHAKLGLPCQSASPARSSAWRLWRRDVPRSISEQIGVDLRGAGVAEPLRLFCAVVDAMRLRCDAISRGRTGGWSREAGQRDAPPQVAPVSVSEREIGFEGLQSCS
jgi:hypothetical protein